MGNEEGFKVFLAEASALLPSPVDARVLPTPTRRALTAEEPGIGRSDDVLTFHSFIEIAQELLQRREVVHPARSDALAEVAPSPGDIAAFQQLVGRASAVLAVECVPWLESVAPLGRMMARREVHDLLHVAGLSFVEDAYIRLLAWALSPDRGLGVSTRLQERWLREMPWGRDHTVGTATVPRYEVPLGSGRVDLRLTYPDLDVLIEGKTGTIEHLVGSTDESQMAHYLTHADDGTRLVRGILIGPEALPPVVPDARVASTTFASFGRLLLVEALEAPEALDLAFFQIGLHFLQHAVPLRCPMGRLLPLVPEILTRATTDPSVIALHFDDIQACRRILPQELR